MSASDKITRYPVPDTTIAQPCLTQLTIRKSLFVTRIFRCADSGSARDCVAALRKNFPDATHHCWAFAAGPPGETANVGFSDDGEPHGTAGRPMLNVLLHSGIGQIGAVVSRWFGGVKLGTGGLARAYQESVLENLKLLPLVECVPRVCWKVELGYSSLEIIRRSLPQVEGMVEKENYEETIRLLISIPLDKAPGFPGWLAGLTNGSARASECACPDAKPAPIYHINKK